jgi:hypothetical protein
MAKKQGVPITTRALVQRINRALGKRDEVLKITRGERARSDLGDFYVLDVSMNAVVSKDVDPEELGRKLGVLKEWERVVEEEHHGKA